MISIENQIKTILQSISKSPNDTGFSIMQACQKTVTSATSKELYLTFVTLDNHGHLNFLYRDPKSLFVSLELAQKKAFTSFSMQMNSSKIQELTQPGGSLYQLESSTQGKIVSFAGGIYVPPEQCLEISAIGVSGALNPIDDETYGNIFLTNIKNYLK